MAEWMMVRLDGKDAAIQTYRLHGQFEAIFITALSPGDAALFSDKDPTRGQYVFYFSPKAAEIFKFFLPRYNPRPCEAPARGAVDLEIGHSDAAKMLPA